MALFNASVSFLHPGTIFFLGIAAGLFLADATASKIRKQQKQQAVLTAAAERPAPRRFGAAIQLRPGMRERYRQLHDHVWLQVLDRMTQSNVRNFTVYYHEETHTLFQHFEWIGHWGKPKEDEKELFQADMRAIAQDPIVRKWWSECEPCQQPFSHWPKDAEPPSRGNSQDSWWSPMECVAHCGHWPVAFAQSQRDPDFVTMS
jgi:L-rhamnose mutarotase